MLYKPGDTVIIRSDLQLGATYYSADGNSCDNVVDDMIELAGKTVEIKSTTTHGKYRLSGNDYNWVDGMFADLIGDDNQLEVDDADMSDFFSLML